MFTNSKIFRVIMAYSHLDVKVGRLTRAACATIMPTMRDEFDVQRFRSTRAYRRFVDRMLHDALDGKRSMAEVAQAAAAAKIGCELFMVEKTLARAGEDAEPDAGKHGDDGGIKMPSGVKPFRRKKVTVKTGIGKGGERVDEKAVSIETSGEDKGAEEAAEVETLS